MLHHHRQSRYIANVQRQRGAVLIICLVLLDIVSLFAVTSIESSGGDIKMASSYQQRSQIFSAAEDAMARIKRDIKTTIKPQIYNFFTDTCDDSKQGNQCFNPECNNGLCFSGIYLQSEPKRIHCNPHGRQQALITPWQDTTVWSDRDKHKKLTGFFDGAKPEDQPRYIIEFLCFVDIPGDGQRFGASSPNGGIPLYRITLQMVIGDKIFRIQESVPMFL